MNRASAACPEPSQDGRPRQAEASQASPRSDRQMSLAAAHRSQNGPGMTSGCRAVELCFQAATGRGGPPIDLGVGGGRWAARSVGSWTRTSSSSSGALCVPRSIPPPTPIRTAARPRSSCAPGDPAAGRQRDDPPALPAGPGPRRFDRPGSSLPQVSPGAAKASHGPVPRPPAHESGALDHGEFRRTGSRSARRGIGVRHEVPDPRTLQPGANGAGSQGRLSARSRRCALAASWSMESQGRMERRSSKYASWCARATGPGRLSEQRCGGQEARRTAMRDRPPNATNGWARILSMLVNLNSVNRPIMPGCIADRRSRIACGQDPARAAARSPRQAQDRGVIRAARDPDREGKESRSINRQHGPMIDVRPPSEPPGNPARIDEQIDISRPPPSRMASVLSARHPIWTAPGRPLGLRRSTSHHR